MKTEKTVENEGSQEQNVSYDNDICFKCYFGGMDEDSQFLRNSMCEYAIGNGVKIVHSDVINSEIIPDHLGKKKVILDIRAKDKQGRLYAIEMQKQPTQTDINRWEYYGARNLTKQLNQGYEYAVIAPVYQIIFTYRHENNNELINRYVMRNEHGQKEQKQPLLNRIYINISAIDDIVEEKGINGLNEYEKIFYLFKNNGLCDTMKLGKMVNKIMDMYDNLKNDDEQWTMAQKIEEAEVRERYAMQQYREEGKKEGREEGREEGKQEGRAEGTIIATMNHVKKLMQKNHFSVEEAMDMLDVEENIRPVILEELQKQTNQK